MTTSTIKTGTWSKGFRYTSDMTDISITIEPTINGSNGRIRSYAGWVHGVDGVGPCTPGNPKGKGRIYLGHYKPQFKKLLADRIEEDLAPKYLQPEANEVTL